MNPLTLEWIQKAEGDYHTSLREVRSRMHPNYDAACFHAQQCIEKYLKACLQENRVDIPRVHKLVDLMVLCMQFDPAFLLIEPDVKVLSGYEVRFRYPG